MRVLRTVTLNSGYDDYYTVPDPVWGGVAPMHAFRSVCSGKGVSCARAAVALGVPTVAYALIGADDEADFSARLDAEGIDHVLVSVAGRTRHNLTLLDPAGEKVAAHYMAAGFELSGPDVVAPLFERVLSDAQPGDIVTLNGSTPMGLPDSTWADLARRLIERGIDVLIDAQRAAFVEALRVPGVVAFKPNDEEILALPEVAAAAVADRPRVALDALARAGVRLPLVSLGARGVIWRDGDRTVRSSCPVERPVQSVMAGDTFLAGLAWGMLASPSADDHILHALAAAAAHVAGFAGADLLAVARQNLSAVIGD